MHTGAPPPADHADEALALVRGALGAPFYECPGCLIYAQDCLDAMQHIPQPFIDLCVTSPPYNIGKAYEQRLPLPRYLDWCAAWIGAVHRLTLPAGAFWLNLGYIALPGRAKSIPLPYLLWERVPFFLVQEVVWNYGAGVAGRKFFSPRNEKFLWYVMDEQHYTFNLDAIRDPDVKYPNQKKHGKIKVNQHGKNPSDVWQIPKVTSGKNRSSREREPHPAQFPEAVVERIIRASSNPGDVVFDPFLGSGTTASVALRLERRVVGFDIAPDYCRIAAERVERQRHTATTAQAMAEG
jgi:adenine-specific DNA-methyltransferase